MADKRMTLEAPRPSRIAAEVGWYELFSRGARDWLRHNEKIRAAVKDHLRTMTNAPDVLSGGNGRVLVPVRLLEHARFRLRDPQSGTGVGQGEGKPGDVLRPGQQPQGGSDQGQ